MRKCCVKLAPLSQTLEKNIHRIFWECLLLANEEKWGGQMFIVTLVFEDFGKNINKVFWGCLFLTSEEEWRFYWWVGWSNDPNT